MSTTDASRSAHSRGSESWSRTHFSVDRRGARYCRVTFDHPPINTITATTVAELAELVTLIEQDPAIARTKSHVDQVTLPANSELGPPLDDFRELFARPAQQAQWARLQELGLNTDSDLERSLGGRVLESIPDA